jgi:hypothetical protein
VPAIGFDVASKGRDLVQLSLGVQDPNGSEPDSDGYRSAEETLHHLRFSGGCQIDITMMIIEQSIANRPSYGPRLVAFVLECLGDRDDFLGKIENRWEG